MLNGEWYVDIFVESKAQMSIAAVSSICCRTIFSWPFQVESAAVWAEWLFTTWDVTARAYLPSPTLSWEYFSSETSSFCRFAHIGREKCNQKQNIAR